MKRLPVLMMVLALVVGATGCRQYNWFRQPSGAAITPSVTYSKPAMPAATCVSPNAAAPATLPVLYGPGDNARSSAMPILPDARGYAPAPG
jgi:hypothetical protein